MNPNRSSRQPSTPRSAHSEPAQGSRRFLVADEVGLGKTIVASGIIERISARRSTPLRVFYVCSNLAIATQNLARLVSFLPDDERKCAIAKVDRPSLMPTRDPPAHGAVQVFSLTPDTALPSRRRRRREGRVEERALGFALLNEFLPRTIPGLYRALRVNVGPQRFRRWVRHYRNAIRNREIADRSFRSAFRNALRIELGLEPGQHLPPRIQCARQPATTALNWLPPCEARSRLPRSSRSDPIW